MTTAFVPPPPIKKNGRFVYWVKIKTQQAGIFNSKKTKVKFNKDKGVEVIIFNFKDSVIINDH